MADEILQQAFALLERGDRDAAKMLLTQFVNRNPSSLNAWYGLTFCTEDVEQKKECLRRVLAINPNTPRVRVLLDDLEAGKPFPQTPELAKSQGDKLVQDAISPQTSIPNSPEPNKVAVPNEYVAGRSTRVMAKRRRFSALWIGLSVVLVAGLLMSIIAFFIIPNAKGWGLTGSIFALLMMALISRNIIDLFMDRKLKEARRADRGADAEERVGVLLESLGEDYIMLHDVPCDYGNIDHVVFSKAGGIFMIETKSHGGKVSIENDKLLLNGHAPEKDFIAQSLSNSFWLRDKLGLVLGSKPWITSILVFTNAFVPYLKPVKGVNVINKKFLLRTIHSHAKDISGGSLIWENRDEIIKLLSVCETRLYHSP